MPLAISLLRPEPQCHNKHLFHPVLTCRSPRLFLNVLVRCIRSSLRYVARPLFDVHSAQCHSVTSSMQIKGKPHNVHNNYHMTEPPHAPRRPRWNVTSGDLSHFIPFDLCGEIWVVVSSVDLRMQRVKGELRSKEALLEQVGGLARSEPHRPCLSRQGRFQPCLWRAAYSPPGGHTPPRTPPFHQVSLAKCHHIDFVCTCN